MARSRQSRHGPLTWVVFLLVFGAAIEAWSQDDASRNQASLRRLLFEEAPRDWARLEESTRRIAASGTWREVLKDRDGKVVSERSSEHSIYTNGDWERQDYASSDTGGTPKSLGVGPRYGFAVARSSKEGPYAAYHVGELDGTGDDTKMREELDSGMIRSFTESSWSVFGKPLSDLVRDPAFSLKSLIPVPRDGETLARMEFDWPHPEGKGYPVFVGGSILLAPDENWAIREYDFRTALGRTQGSVSYDRAAEGLPVPRKIEVTTRYGRSEKREDPDQYDGYVQTDTFTFDEYEYKEVPAETFTLSAFGLPEREADTSWTAWLLIASGILATAVSFYLLYRRRMTA